MSERRRPPEPTDEELVALRFRAKAELRKRIAAIRRALPAEASASRSRAIATHVIGLDAFARARTIAAYVPMRREVDPSPIAKEAREREKAVVLPRVDWATDSLTLHPFERMEDLEESGMGFFQPREGAPRVAPSTVDLVLVPALAVDGRGHRIGWGKGFYDRLLPTLVNATSVALVYDFQLLAEVPETPGDVAVDRIAYDRGVIEIDRAAR